MPKAQVLDEGGILHDGRRYNKGETVDFTDEHANAHRNLVRDGRIRTLTDELGGPVVTGDMKGNVKGISPASDSQNPEEEANAFADEQGNAEQQNQTNAEKKSVSAKAKKGK